MGDRTRVYARSHELEALYLGGTFCLQPGFCKEIFEPKQEHGMNCIWHMSRD
jgi:hypothetical protein